MSKKILIIPAVLLALVLTVSGAVFAYDGARPERIAEGIRVGGVDVGGLAPGAARARVRRELVASLERPVVVRRAKRTWKLRAREARLETNAEQVVADALKRSDEGGVLGRTYRRLSGGRVDAQLQPAVTFSDRAVIRLVDRVRKGVERPAENAEVKLTPSGVQTEPGRRGVRVRAASLHKAINAALVSPSAKRSFTASVRKVSPSVTRADLAKRNPVVLIADRAGHTLKVYKNLKLSKSYNIAAGQAAYPTPAGQFTIANKAVNPTWSVPDSAWAGSLAGSVIPGGAPENPLKARWLGITDGVGIHGTSDEGSIGSNASHGCLRMRVADVVDLYPRVPVGAKILIA